jgi:hypothetical protein
VAYSCVRTHPSSFSSIRMAESLPPSGLCNEFRSSTFDREEKIV